MLRMPSRVVFPFGYRISVRQFPIRRWTVGIRMPMAFGTTTQKLFIFVSACP